MTTEVQDTKQETTVALVKHKCDFCDADITCKEPRKEVCSCDWQEVVQDEGKARLAFWCDSTCYEEDMGSDTSDTDDDLTQSD